MPDLSLSVRFGLRDLPVGGVVLLPLSYDLGPAGRQAVPKQTWVMVLRRESTGEWLGKRARRAGVALTPKRLSVAWGPEGATVTRMA